MSAPVAAAPAQVDGRPLEVRLRTAGATAETAPDVAIFSDVRVVDDAETFSELCLRCLTSIRTSLGSGSERLLLEAVQAAFVHEGNTVSVPAPASTSVAATLLSLPDVTQLLFDLPNDAMAAPSLPGTNDSKEGVQQTAALTQQRDQHPALVDGSPSAGIAIVPLLPLSVQHHGTDSSPAGPGVQGGGSGKGNGGLNWRKRLVRAVIIAAKVILTIEAVKWLRDRAVDWADPSGSETGSETDSGSNGNSLDKDLTAVLDYLMGAEDARTVQRMRQMPVERLKRSLRAVDTEIIEDMGLPNAKEIRGNIAAMLRQVEEQEEAALKEMRRQRREQQRREGRPVEDDEEEGEGIPGFGPPAQARRAVAAGEEVGAVPAAAATGPDAPVAAGAVGEAEGMDRKQ